MAFKVVLRAVEPSGRILALLCARTGETIDAVRKQLASRDGLALREGISREDADSILSSLPDDDSVEVSVCREVDSWVAVLVGYRPGSRGRLRVALQKMSRLTTEEVIHFLASIPVALKTGIPMKTAGKIKELLEREGGIIEIRPCTIVQERSPVTMAAEEREEGPSLPAEALEEPIDGPPGMEPRVPPKVSETRKALRPVMNVQPPHEICFDPPEREVVSAPPLPDDIRGILPGKDIPHSFRFTIPVRSIPPRVWSGEPEDLPEQRDRTDIFPIYLHPVAPENVEEVCESLSAVLALPGSRSRELVEKAPAAVWATGDRLNALVTLRNLSERGVPVSLFPGGGKDPSGKRQGLFPGWMNGFS